MKRIFLILLISLFAIDAYGQDSEPTPWNFIWGTDPNPRIFQPDSQSTFFTGFQWSGTGKMNNALLNNAVAEGGDGYDPNAIYDTPLLGIKQATYQNNNYDIVGIWNCMSLQYEPTLYIDPDSTGLFKTRLNDPADPIFGFSHIVGHIISPDSSNNENYSRLLLNKDLADAGDTIILSDTWEPVLLHTFVGHSQIFGSRGQMWYVSINLRRLDPIENPEQDTTRVLTIKLPYSTTSATVNGLITFDSIPKSYPDVYQLDYYNDRGIAMELKDTTTNEFIIRRDMLPANSNNPDITLSAHFITNGDTLFHDYNYPFIPGAGVPFPNTAKIDTMDIEVTYHGGCDIGIDWIRIENHMAHCLFRGMVDSLGLPGDTIGRITHYNVPSDPTAIFEQKSIKDIIQTFVDSLNKFQIPGHPKNQLFRFYGQDVESHEPMWWGQLRYYNLITNGMAVTRDHPYLCDHYYHYTKAPNRYFGIKLSEAEGLVLVPYLRKADQGYMGFKWGYFAEDTMHRGMDTLYSSYETSIGADTSFHWLPADGFFQKVVGFDIHNDPLAMDSLRKTYGYSDGVQIQWEAMNQRIFYDNRDYLYSDKPWWMNYFIGAIWSCDTLNMEARVGGLRPKTGEEARLMIMKSLLMGAKGLFYDREHADPLPSGMLGIGDGTQIDSTANPPITIESDEVGGDFMLQENDPWNFDDYIDFDQWETRSTTDRDRLYIGMKSTRMEIYKIHQWIRSVEDVLMQLRLVAWFGKDFHKWQHQHPDYPANVLENFIDAANIRTRKLFQPNDVGPSNNNSPIENPDSSFFDITLLSHTTDPDMDSVFFVGVQNRRTDPLIRNYDLYGDTRIDSSMKFYSSAEFDHNARYGGANISGHGKDSLYWQDLWWKRLGCREITLPFQFEYSSEDHEYALLKVTELGVGTSIDDDDLLAWGDRKFYHRIDTVVGQDKSIKIKMLPGEGKILKVEILPPANEFDGILAYSNQRKMVAYPALNAMGTGPDFVRWYYHLVFHKNVSGINKIYYTRTKLPIDQYSSSENLQWENPKLVSDSIRCGCETGDILTNLNCAYPSIVVRPDVNEQKAYIVYTCSATQNCNEAEFGQYQDQLLISETILNNVSNSNFGEIEIESRKVLEHIHGDDIDEWGTPMVNASANRNYYTWSDAVRGIGVDFHAPDESCFAANSSTYIKFNNDSISQHPSLNSYSRFLPTSGGQNEDVCALVWQGNITGGQGELNNVYYTNLGVDNGVVQNSLPNTISGYPVSDYLMSADGNSMQLHIPGMNDNKFPVVHRGLSSSASFTDRIAWESHTNEQICSLTGAEAFTKLKTIEKDAVFPPSATAYATTNLMGAFSLTRPSISQGNYIKGIADENISKKAVSLDVKTIMCTFKNPFYIITTPGIIHVPHGLKDWVGNTIGSPSQAGEYVCEGDYPQLAARPNVEDEYELWKNRRVFSEYPLGSPNTTIITNAKMFYKGNDNNLTLVPFLGFHKASGKRIFSMPKLNSEMIRFDTRYIYPLMYDSTERRRSAISNLDTISTEWFTASANADLEFRAWGMDTTEIEVIIERRSNRARARLSLSNIPDSIMQRLNFRMVNGNRNEYRLLFINVSDSLIFSENLLLMNDEDDLLRSEKFAAREQIIDLSKLEDDKYLSDHLSLSVYPNPADEEIYVTALLPVEYAADQASGAIEMRMYSSIGKEVYRVACAPGETVIIPTSRMPAGMYVIRANPASQSRTTHPLHTSQTVIINR